MIPKNSKQKGTPKKYNVKKVRYIDDTEILILTDELPQYMLDKLMRVEKDENK